MNGPLRVIPVLLGVVLFLVPAESAAARLILDAGTQAVYEDNITGSVEEVTKRSDLYIVASASLGVSKDLGDGLTSVFVQGDAYGYAFSDNTDLNSTIVGLSAGASRKFTDILSGKATFKVRGKDFNDSRRDSSSLGAALELREELSYRLALKQGYEFETNDAESAFFSYQSHLVGASVEYSITPRTLLRAGYYYLTTEYEEPAGFKNDFHTLSVGVVRKVLDRVYLRGGYDHQFISSSDSQTGSGNNILALGIAYSY